MKVVALRNMSLNWSEPLARALNPARSLGAAVIVGGVALNQLWLFWVAPIIGGLLAAAVWKILQ